MDLESCRRRIDEIDKEMVALLNERGKLALDIKNIKAESGRPIFDPQREKLVLSNLTAANDGPLPDASLHAIYREVMSACRQLEHPLRIAYLGPAATFTHQAARLKFGSSTEFIPARNTDEVFVMAEKGEADFGVVPVENSTDGFVPHTFDLLADSDLTICAEIALPISQCLLAQGTLADIRKVYSHPQGLGQTRGWLQRHLPDAERFEVTSTARAAEIAAEDPSAAAVCNELAAEVYGLNVIAQGIQDGAANITRFLVIGKEMAQRTGNDKTAVMFAVKNRVGALHDCLELLVHNGVDMTRIESRPSKLKTWDYVFFMDIVGHPDDARISAMLAALAEECMLVKILGCWPVA